MSVAFASGVVSALRQSALFKALASYASAAWVLLEVVSTFIEGLGLPGWVFTGVLLILIVGIPMMVLAARNSEKDPTAPGAPESGITRRLTLKRAWLGGGAMIAAFSTLVALFMASWAFGIGPAASLLAAGSLEKSDPILIADFGNKSRDPTLAGTVTEVVRLDLSQSRVIRVLDREQVGEALDRMNRASDSALKPEVARELAVREGIPAVLEGEVSSLGPATIISARLVDPRRGAVMAEYVERAESPDKLLSAVDRLAGTLRNKIGEPLTSIRIEPPLEKVTTASIEALKAYTKANASHASGDEDRAIEHLRTALEHDATFPMAWRKLGALINDDDPVAAKNAYRNAFRLRDNLPERERDLAAASYFKNVDGNLRRAMDAYSKVLLTHPHDEVALTNLANLYTAFRRPEEARELYERVIKLRPRFAAYSNLFNALVRTGQIDRARAVHEEAARLYSKQKRVKFQPIILAMAEGDLPRADRLFRHFLKANSGNDELLNDLFVARYHWHRGRFAEAQAIFRVRARKAFEKGDVGDAIEAMTSVVAIAHATGDVEQGRAILQEALKAYPLESLAEERRPQIDLAIAYALVGQANKAREHLSLASKQGPQDGSLLYDHQQRALGLIAHAEGRYRDAVRILSSGARFGQCETCLLFDLGLAAEAAGQKEEAIAAYEQFVRLAPFALTRGENHGVVLLHLAALYEAIDQPKAAMKTRAALQKLWNSANSELMANIEKRLNAAALSI